MKKVSRAIGRALLETTTTFYEVTNEFIREIICFLVISQNISVRIGCGLIPQQPDV